MGNISMHLRHDNNVRSLTEPWSGLVFVCRRRTGLFRWGIGALNTYEQNGWDWNKDIIRLCEYAQSCHKRGMIIGWYTPDGSIYTYDHDRENTGKRLEVVRVCALADPYEEPYLTVVSGRDQREAGLFFEPEVLV